MLEMIHTESPGHLGYSLAIVFYFACVTVMFLAVTMVIMPAAKSLFGKSAALVLTHMLA